MDNRLRQISDGLAACDLAELWTIQRWLMARIAEVEATMPPQAVAQARQADRAAAGPSTGYGGPAERIAHLETPARDAAGTVYQVDVFGRRDGVTWEGWLVFTPAGGQALRTGTETTQPDRPSLAYWAGGLEPVYVDGALARARRHVGA